MRKAKNLVKEKREYGYYYPYAFSGCRNLRTLTSSAMKRKLRQAIENAGIKTYGATAFHKFPLSTCGNEEGGYTCLIVIGASHVDVHTYPEKNRCVHIGISICDFVKENIVKRDIFLASLKEELGPTIVRVSKPVKRLIG